MNAARYLHGMPTRGSIYTRDQLVTQQLLGLLIARKGQLMGTINGILFD